jgi:sugar phosphate isomerase/epimerase
VYLAASSNCFPELSFEVALSKLVDLEYTRIEIPIDENSTHLKPSEVTADLERAIAICRQTQRLTPVVYNIHISAEGDDYYRQFSAICSLAKATKVVTLVIPSAELGTPFNAEVEHLQRLVNIATNEGAVVAIKTQIGRISEDPDTVGVLCDHVKGLGVALDPSHFYYGVNAGRSFDQILKYTCHVYLRDTNKENMQVRVGQGDIEYGRLVNMLLQAKYNRALSVDIQPMPEVDQMAELRKMRLLVESLL